MTESILELRQYVLRPGRRDRFVERFEREFVDTQEEQGIRVVGTFLDLDHPDRFVWLRAFASYDDRERALTAFYVDGPVWASLKDETNADLIDSDDVLVLAPLAHVAAPAVTRDEVEIHVWAAGSDGGAAVLEALAPVPCHTLAASDPRPNNFPRQPVRDDPAVVLVAPTSPVTVGGRLQRLRLAPTPRSVLR